MPKKANKEKLIECYTRYTFLMLLPNRPVLLWYGQDLVLIVADIFKININACLFDSNTGKCD